jgi:hypothetical protein
MPQAQHRARSLLISASASTPFRTYTASLFFTLPLPCLPAAQAQRPLPVVAEAQRRAQLSQLGPLLPEGPDKLLAAYKQVAVTFQLHRVRGFAGWPGHPFADLCTLVKTECILPVHPVQPSASASASTIQVVIVRGWVTVRVYSACVLSHSEWLAGWHADEMWVRQHTGGSSYHTVMRVGGGGDLHWP